MPRRIVGSILHGAYGDVYEQALCLKHYALTHPEVELRLFGSTPTRLEAFRALDLSFASSFRLWNVIADEPEIDAFFQFQVMDKGLQKDILNQLPPAIAARVDRTVNHLPWAYMRDHGLMPAPPELQLSLSESGEQDFERILLESHVPADIWERPTISFLWRYRHAGHGHGISSFGQKDQQTLVREYSEVFQELLAKTDAHLLVFGMNLVATDAERVRTDNKYAPFGLDVPPNRVTYMKGLSWPLELEIASRTTVCCGNASGFTEALWLKGRDVILMDAPYHYLAKVVKHRVRIFGLRRPGPMLQAWFLRSPAAYRRRAFRVLRASAR